MCFLELELEVVLLRRAKEDGIETNPIKNKYVPVLEVKVSDLVNLGSRFVLGPKVLDENSEVNVDLVNLNYSRTNELLSATCATFKSFCQNSNSNSKLFYIVHHKYNNSSCQHLLKLLRYHHHRWHLHCGPWFILVIKRFFSGKIYFLYDFMETISIISTVSTVFYGWQQLYYEGHEWRLRQVGFGFGFGFGGFGDGYGFDPDLEVEMDLGLDLGVEMDMDLDLEGRMDLDLDLGLDSGFGGGVLDMVPSSILP